MSWSSITELQLQLLSSAHEISTLELHNYASEVLAILHWCDPFFYVPYSIIHEVRERLLSKNPSPLLESPSLSDIFTALRAQDYPHTVFLIKQCSSEDCILLYQLVTKGFICHPSQISSEDDNVSSSEEPDEVVSYSSMYYQLATTYAKYTGDEYWVHRFHALQAKVHLLALTDHAVRKYKWVVRPLNYRRCFLIVFQNSSHLTVLTEHGEVLCLSSVQLSYFTFQCQQVTNMVFELAFPKGYGTFPQWVDFASLEEVVTYGFFHDTGVEEKEFLPKVNASSDYSKRYFELSKFVHDKSTINFVIGSIQNYVETHSPMSIEGRRGREHAILTPNIEHLETDGELDMESSISSVIENENEPIHTLLRAIHASVQDPDPAEPADVTSSLQNSFFEVQQTTATYVAEPDDATPGPELLLLLLRRGFTSAN